MDGGNEKYVKRFGRDASENLSFERPRRRWEDSTTILVYLFGNIFMVYLAMLSVTQTI
jgi:hypothetical protein